ncbi:MAG: hypothetical protein ACXVAX_04215 [Pseudobdellovibrio sp.]
MNSDTYIFRSKGGLFPHTHKLNISKELLLHSKQSITATTSAEYSLIFRHQHEVTITLQELEKVRNGQSVVVRDNNTGRHTFEIKL